MKMLRFLKREPWFVAETLNWCNEQRAEQGKEPLDQLPTGSRKDPTSCPCGKATGYDVFAGFYGHSRVTLHQTPEAVRKFMVAFDDGKLPQYDEEKA